MAIMAYKLHARIYEPVGGVKPEANLKFKL